MGGLVRTSLTLTNPKEPDLAAIEVDAFVDTGAVHLCMSEAVAIRLRLDELEKREVTVPDGSRRLVPPYVGPITTSFGNRSCYMDAMVLGDGVLLGAIRMEDMDLVVRPLSGNVAPNPKSPNIPASIAMGVRHR